MSSMTETCAGSTVDMTYFDTLMDMVNETNTAEEAIALLQAGRRLSLSDGQMSGLLEAVLQRLDRPWHNNLISPLSSLT